MNFDPNTVMPVPSNWFNPNIEYKGQGRAEFSNPKGFIEGSIKASFNEYGEYTFQMDVTDWGSDDPAMQLDIQFLNVGGAHINTCNSLLVTLPDGNLVADEEIHYSPYFTISAVEGESRTWVKFRIHKLRFESTNKSAPVYWVLPLSNFVSEYMQQDITLAHHPLRITPSSEIPAGLNDKDLDLATFIANQNNRLVIFHFNGETGFIEPLADYKERKDKLESGRERNIITAIMIGAISGNPCENFAELQAWFPIDFLHLLGIASGSEVGASSIEIRNASGDLIRRIHVDLGSPSYIKGHCAIDEAFHRGTGLLLTQACNSQYWGQSLFRVLLRHVLRGGFKKHSMLEDRFTYLCRAFEALAKYFGLDTQQLLNQLNPADQVTITSILQQASQQVSGLATSLDASNFHAARILRSIEGRVRGASEKSKDFGLSVCDLLDKFHLPDASIVDAYYAIKPRSDGLALFSQILSYYRGSVIHEGFFDISSRRHDRNDIWIYISHLHDILLRIVFKMAGYTGKYDPTVGQHTLVKEVDWVETSTSAAELGYQ